MVLAKKIFLISSSILTIVLLVWGVYVLSFKKEPPQSATGEENENPISASAPKNNFSQIIAVSDEAVLSPTLTKDGSAIKYYSKQTGKVYQADFDGQNKKALSVSELPGLIDVFWSPDKAKVISKFLKNGKFSFFLYDYNENKGVPLKDNLDSVAWQNNNKIFYKYYDPKKNQRTLNISDPNGSNWNKITDLDFKNVSIAPIPKTGLVSFWNKPDAYQETLFQSISIISGEAKTVFKEKFGADYLWSNDGSNALVSHADGKGGSKMQLALINSQGGEYKNLGIPTFVSKCVWSKDNKTAYCALPGSVPESAVLPNDYQNNKFATADTFWKVDTITGEKSRLVDLEKIKEKFDAANLFLNLDESFLFFVNKTDGKLYRISL